MACHAIKKLIGVVLLNTFIVLAVLADPGKLISAEDLSRLASEAQQRRLPILLMVSRHHCGFCDRMKEEALQPMLLSGLYRNRILMRELSIDPGEMITNFQGKRENAVDFIRQYQVYVTPTLLFLDAEGKETAERIVGINTVDYLIFYIEEAIDEATADITH
ncbi:MAG: thioredoxin fold domain-containing protein [Candidatus Thiodiazotropha sp. (ex Epidulcina cf. delphinae)]|nr:thioredoxin fold domain-containing protein [Candidatus Thiodiazotropha sp. (ex Epidulcina cf. delphinae)]